MKTINLSNLRIREAVLTENAGEYTLSVAYTLLDDTNNDIMTKTKVVSTFTSLQKTALASIFAMVGTKIKQIEGL